MLVAEGKGIYIVCGDQIQRSFTNEVVMVPLDEPKATFAVHVAWRKQEGSAAVLKLLTTIFEFYGTERFAGVSRRRKTSRNSAVDVTSR